MKLNTRWMPLLTTSFLGVFNENYFKLLIIGIGVKWMVDDPGNHSLIVAVASGLLFVSYIFFSPLAGRLAKTMYKKDILKWAVVIQFPVYLLGCVGFYLENMPIVLICIFLIGLISTLYGPAKYGLIRDIGGNEGISFGTGTLEMLTFFGNILGPMCGSFIADNYNFWLLSGILMSVSVLGYFFVVRLKVKETEPLKNVTETINPYKFMIHSYKWAGTYTGMNLIVLGLSLFWTIDAVLQMNLFVHCPDVLKMSNTGMSIVMTIALFGIGLGSYLAGVISKGKVELLLTPIGGIGMSICFLIMILLKPADVVVFSALTFFIAMFSGIFMVPLSSYLQAKIEGRRQSDMIAYSNFTTFVLLFSASVLFGIISNQLGSYAVFIFLLIVVVAISFVLIRFVPEIRSRIKEVIGIK